MFNRKAPGGYPGAFFIRGIEIMPDWYLYMVRCRDGTLYTGIATDVARRLEEHEGRGSKGAKYLRGRGPLSLVFKVKVGDKGLALRLECKVKRLSKYRKEELISDERIINDLMSDESFCRASQA